MTVAIIPDIHNKINKAQKILDSLERDNDIKHIIFLGDYFDDFNDNPEIAKETALWLKKSLDTPNRTHLVGNHDLPYLFPYNPHVWCPGWSKEKQKNVSKILTTQDAPKLQPYVILENINKDSPPTLISHAGFSLASIYGLKTPDELDKGGRLKFIKDIPINETLKKIQQETKNWYNCLVDGTFHYFMEQGTRVGDTNHGGPQWLDWGDLSPIKNLNQIVGHSIVRYPEEKCQQTSNNYCIDTNLNYIAMFDTVTHSLTTYPTSPIIEHKGSLEWKSQIGIWKKSQDIATKNLKLTASWSPNIS